MSADEEFANRAGGALVVGGSGGLGRSSALLLAANGSRVAVTYRARGDVAGEIVEEITARGTQAVALELDVVDADAAQRAVDEAASILGGLHTLVFAAGPNVAQRHLSTVEPETFRAHLLAEAAGFFNVVHPSLPHLRRSKGSIVAITTAATRRFPVRDGLSSGTKGAVEQLVRALAVEEGRFEVRANSVGPGMLTDGMAARLMASGDLDDAALAVTRANIPLRRFGSARDVAEAVVFLASDRAGFISGQHLCVDGGYSA